MAKPTTEELIQRMSQNGAGTGEKRTEAVEDPAMLRARLIEALKKARLIEREEDLLPCASQPDPARPPAPSSLPAQSVSPQSISPSSNSTLTAADQESPASSSSSELSHDSSDEESQESTMCSPKTAKELSLSTGQYHAVTSDHQSGQEPDDEPQAPGLVLGGYVSGKPVYFATKETSEPKAIETKTAIGLRHVQQPIETCFGQTPTDVLAGAESNQPSLPSMPPNRTFSNDWFAVGKSSLGGYGISAAVDIPKHTHFLVEKPFIRLKKYCELPGKYAKLSQEEKLVFDNLHEFDKQDRAPVFKKWNANSFVLGQGEGCFAIASNFNHACHSKRNAQYCWDGKRRVMTFTSIREIAKGEEIFISYGSVWELLLEKFGFAFGRDEDCI
ncbi:hypothetical protein M406DRAFT_70848 [Cryphonectria parasitica EP155]|uniref:SET domain-containing protein n=1 Tax=Cryphonectria parasitica (strain ATCC 38755 / EP155) TaxID=660469 RepID=A0A9P4Y1C0_CRYP1|nr:uncharacterized protein M406DRAFT_70848 [Cryphonectria parasitica EP155]KAF3764620.1 hypothetical protein M406DRAFT_70848 [Cryphonectria parasitica EP155]